MKPFFTLFLNFFLLLGLTLTVSANADPDLHEHDTIKEVEHQHVQHDKKFNAGEMIVEHVKDAYEWHILAWKTKHISVYLPIILFDWETNSFTAFCSKHFHHGHSAYKGFAIAQEGKNKGSIVKVDEHGIEIANTSLPLDLSITKDVLEIFIIAIIMLWMFISIANRYKRRKNEAPKGLQSLIEPIIIFIRNDIAIPSIGAHKYERYMPYLLTVFFFIFVSNLIGLIPFYPFGANVTGNISVTLTLAAFTFLITTFIGNKNYWKHIFNAPGVPWWLKIPIPLMPIVELLGVFTKPIVLMIRLFANILAGHIIILGFMSLIFIFGSMNMWFGYGASVISVAFGLFMSLLELLVAFIQAFVFTMLSALYFGMAVEEEHH